MGSWAACATGSATATMLRMNESLCLAVITVKRCFIVVFFRSECIRRNGIQAEHGLWMRKGALVSEKLSDGTGQKHAKSDNGGTMIPRVPLAWLADHARPYATAETASEYGTIKKPEGDAEDR